jgi:Protein of unknown function (DUF3634)
MGLRCLKLKAQFSTARVVILIRDGKAVGIKGTVSVSILTAFSDVARAHAIDQAMITVSKSGGSVVLRFSGPVTDAARQRFRNIWFSYPERRMVRL